MNVDSAPAIAPTADAGPFGLLPRRTRRQVRLEALLARGEAARGLAAATAWLAGPLGAELGFGYPEIVWRAAGLKRPGAIAQLSWPARGLRIGLGLEPAFAHALVDRLLGFERMPGEERLQVTPVSWGILTFAIARTLEELSARGELSLDGLFLDRVGPEPFQAEGLGEIVTVRWPVRLGSSFGSVRCWLPESLVAAWTQTTPPPPRHFAPEELMRRFGVLDATWRAEAGSVALSGGLAALHTDIILPVIGLPSEERPVNPAKRVILAVRGPEGRFGFPAELVAGSSGARIVIRHALRLDPSLPLDRPAMPEPSGSPPSPTDVPVSLVVELGRVSIPLQHLADLKPGDTLNLNRHAREPVELTSGGRLVARGELIQVDDTLGVRVTSVFL